METHPAVQDVDKPLPASTTKCPMTAALNAVGGKWSLICLYWLDSGTRRFNELRRLMPGISHKVLTATLRSLEDEGLIWRTVYAEVPRELSTASPATEKPCARSLEPSGRGDANILNGNRKRLSRLLPSNQTRPRAKDASIGNRETEKANRQ